ncbi:hypothetical protein GWR56_09390 [Mucilaginibacter sp. 14171R-50]|uniref:translation initiation factor IF-3 n=1 Tax=Mucilaginibacter sp. 14171R-50 TaxID=2703789 RepID=UPI00138D6885|nr:translation initiation factor IF-3 [Mucilaginibacter sp. 14171R-50]QHS55735.1 hypothetical protein GWR56_09390 [Mucilaginibacter sp. 14171R-50]
MREMKVRPGIDAVEYQEKLSHLIRFLERGDEIKVTVMFRGREVINPERGEELLRSFAADLKDRIKPGSSTVREGRVIYMVLTPNAG